MSRFILATLMLISALLWAAAVNYSLDNTGIWAWTAFVYFAIFSPIMDLILPRDKQNPRDSSEEDHLRHHRYFDFVLFAIIPLALYTVYNSVVHFGEFLGNATSLSELQTALSAKTGSEWLDFAGRWWGVAFYMGGSIINMGHELGHRVDSWQRYLGKTMLFSSLRMAFYIEHNWGHHKDVSTPLDPASAKENEIFWLFWPKSLFGTWINSFKIQKKLLDIREVSFFSVYNDALWNVIIQWGVIIFIAIFVDLGTALAFILVGQGGALILEGANYIEHYGLRRKLLPNGRYERTLPIHSWNANHLWTNLMLYNLMRHSDHHYIAERPYQILRDYPEKEVPMLPLAYTGIAIPALFFPPLYFAMMRPKVKYAMENYDQMKKGNFSPSTK